MNLVIRAVDEERRPELASLARALRSAGAMPGPVEVINSQINPGHLGLAIEAITVAVAAAGAGGSVTVAVRELIRALLSQRSSLEVSVRLGQSQEIRFVANDLPRRMSADELAALAERMAGSLRDGVSPAEVEPVHGNRQAGSR